MSMLDGILGQVGNNVDVGNLATKVGIDPALAEKAIVALGAAHAQPGDTISAATESTGIDSGTLSQIVDHIGGEGALARFNQLLQEHPQAATLMGKLDQDGDGNPLNDVFRAARNLLGET